jgi:hypothetical protein
MGTAANVRRRQNITHHDDRLAGNVTRKNVERLLKSPRKLDEPDRMSFRKPKRKRPKPPITAD